MSETNEKRIITLTDRAYDIRNLECGNNIYLRKTHLGHYYDYLCEFMKFKAGVVTAIIVKSDGQRAMYNGPGKGDVITARIDRCWHWGRDSGDSPDRFYCHWYLKDGTIKRY